MFIGRHAIHSYPTRQENKLHLPRPNTTRYGVNTISYHGALLWNNFCKNTKKPDFYNESKSITF